ncbi:MAG: cell wall hydrolase [Gammaproteobacteria bacterium]|nr:cell wall hydrolase [Gammaproteobacteria bacterium]
MKAWHLIFLALGFFALTAISFDLRMGQKETVDKMVSVEEKLQLLEEKQKSLEEEVKDTQEVVLDLLETPNVSMLPKKQVREVEIVQPPKIIIRGQEVTLEGELRCLALNIYFEGRNRSSFMKEAVGWATANRIGKYGNRNFCDTVTNARWVDGGIEKHQCHFSWYCDGEVIKEVAFNKLEDEAYKRSVDLAKRVIARSTHGGPEADITGGATHYHRDDVEPYWRESMALVGQFDDHIFYIGH